MKTFPAWVLLSLSLAANGLLLLIITLLVLRDGKLPENAPASASAAVTNFQSHPVAASPEPSALGPRRKWTYEDWVAQLGREAAAAAKNQPKHLSVLVGDSLSLWFPNELLPPERTWLNQGISGEISAGLLKRLYLLDSVQPETFFLMIGINDLIRGIDDETLLENQRQIMRELRWVHPHSQIVVQSILPHGGEKATWEGRDRLLEMPNSRIRHLNQKLKEIADQENAYYLDLHPLFTNSKGDLKSELTTDGLHLDYQGYLVWRTALKLFSQTQLELNNNHLTEN